MKKSSVRTRLAPVFAQRLSAIVDFPEAPCPSIATMVTPLLAPRQSASARTAMSSLSSVDKPRPSGARPACSRPPEVPVTVLACSACDGGLTPDIFRLYRSNHSGIQGTATHAPQLPSRTHRLETALRTRTG